MERRSPNAGPALAVAMALAVCLVAFAQTGTAPDLPATPDPAFGPNPYSGASTLEPDGTWTVEVDGLRMRLRALDAEDRAAFLETVAGTTVDPFRTRLDEPPRFLTFVLDLQNAGSGPAVMSPNGIWLQTNRKEIVRPMDRHAVEAGYRLRDADFPPSYQRAASTLFEGDALVPAGERQIGLLVFRRFEKEPRSFRIEIPASSGSGRGATLVADYLEARRLAKKHRKAIERADRQTEAPR